MHISGEGSTWGKLVYNDQQSLTTIAKRMVNRPVVANGGLHNLEVARKVLEEGHADFISLGHAALANPDWPARVREGLAFIDFKRDMATPFPPLQ